MRPKYAPMGKVAIAMPPTSAAPDGKRRASNRIISAMLASWNAMAAPRATAGPSEPARANAAARTRPGPGG